MDKKMKVGLVVVAIFVMFLVISLVGNNQRAEADISESGISINLSFGEIMTLIKTFISGGETLLSGVTNYDSLTLGDDLIVGGSTTLSGALAVSGAIDVGAFTQGGLILATSTIATATTFKADDLLTYAGWEVTVNLADLTYTFPASSTLSALVPIAGDSRTWIIYNATSTAGIDVIFAAGTGTEIKSSGAGGLTIDEESFGSFTLFRKANSDILILTNFPDAD